MLSIFEYSFMIRAFAAGIAIALIAPTIGTFLVVRRYSLVADTLAHVSLTGVAIGLLLGINPVAAAIGTSVLAATGIEYLRTKKNIFGESVLAVFLSASLAIAAILFSITRGIGANLFSFLFGSITTVTANDLFFIAGLGVLVLLSILLFYKEFFLTSFDEELARTNGIKTNFFNLLLIILAAVTVSLAMRIVGILLIDALMVIPVITAMQYKKGFYKTLFMAIIFALVSVISGIFLSYYLDLASGGTIVVVGLILFLGTLFLTRKR